MKRTPAIMLLLPTLICLLISCGPAASPVIQAQPSPTPWATAIPPVPTGESYPPPPTEPPPTMTPTPTPPASPLPALALPEADFDMAEVALLGITRTAGVTLQVQLRSGEVRKIALSPQVVPVDIPYRAHWEEPYLFLKPYELPTDVLFIPLVAVDMIDKTAYRLPVSREYEVPYWADPLVSPNGRQVAMLLNWRYGLPAGPRWEVRAWDLDAGRTTVLLYGGDNRPYSPIYWSQGTGKIYLQQYILESDGIPSELAAIEPDGSGWQVLDEQLRGKVAFSPDGLAAAYLAYDEQLGAGYTYYDPGLAPVANQLWTIELQTGEKRLLLQEADGAQLYEQLLYWTADGILVGQARAASRSSIGEWQVLQVDPSTGAATALFGRQGESAGLFAGPFAPKRGRIFLFNWVSQQYAVLDLESGEMQPVGPLVWGSSFSWCQEGTALVEWYGEHELVYVDLETGAVEPLEGWEQVVFCR